MIESHDRNEAIINLLLDHPEGLRPRRLPASWASTGSPISLYARLPACIFQNEQDVAGRPGLLPIEIEFSLDEPWP